MVRFGKREVGDDAPVFVTFEAGPTHDGLESAKRLCKLAADAGADAVKFQVLDPDRLVADRKQMFAFDVLVDRATGKTETVEEPLYDLLCRRSMPESDWRDLKKHCDSLNLAFFATVSFEEDVTLMESLGCDSIKIASADVNYLSFIRRVARTGMCVQLDTGNATIGEIEQAVDAIRREGNENIIIHQCPSGYPARLESINLQIIPTLKRMFPYPVAFSDHTPGRDMDIAAVALGASLVEKTITEDRTTRSVEHIMSLEPGEMIEFVEAMRDVQTALGGPRRIMHDAELEKRVAVRRSAHLTKPVKAGQCLSKIEVEFRRPGYGIAPDLYEQLGHRTFKADLPAGQMIQLADLA